MKKVLLFLCCITFIITSFSGCNCEKVIADNERYDLIKKGKDFYLMLDESIIETIASNRVDASIIYFDSTEEFIDTVKNGKLDDSQLAIAYEKFNRDSNGIKICDLSNMQEPVLPDEFDWRWGNWSGSSYTFDLYSSNGESGYCKYLDKESYEAEYEKYYKRGYSEKLVLLEKNNDGKKEYYYYSTDIDQERIRYTVKNGRTTLVVFEIFNWKKPKDIPGQIKIYGRNSKHYFIINIYNLKEKPTEEWIKSFGIKD
jgi:hypothetical protein